MVLAKVVKEIPVQTHRLTDRDLGHSIWTWKIERNLLIIAWIVQSAMARQ